MKKLIILLLLLPFFGCEKEAISQNKSSGHYNVLAIGRDQLNIQRPKEKLTEQQIIKNTHIYFTKEYISFVIHGLIEIDGHIFLNDTCKSPVIYKSDLDEITIIKDGAKYKHRKCNIKGCNIIHLEPIDIYLTDPIFKSVLHCTPNIYQVPMQIGSDLKIITP